MMTVNMTALNITELLLTHPRFLGGTDDTKLTLESVSKVATEASDGANLAWMLISGVLVFFMQSGFALLESGTVRFKNNQNILLKNCMDACIGGLIYWLVGFGFAYGAEKGGFIGSKYFAGSDFEKDNKYGEWFFQYAFACTAATIVSGSLAERVNISNYLLFSLYMTGFVYPVVCCWTWGAGWLTEIGYVDFAGSGVVHLTGGVAGFMGAWIMGPRLGMFD